MKGRIFSGMRPTGRLHIGHLSVLENWVKLQDEYECVFGIVDWHALTTAFDNPEEVRKNIKEMLLDWLSAGIDPNKSIIMVQSHVKQHAELHLLLSMITPLSWLERVPTYKDQIQQLGKQGKDISTYGFLGYPLLMAADILVYKADTVPVGEDQLPHLEFTREIARRFNYLYQKEVFPEPQAILSKIPLLPGIDKRKMSKSYDNYIAMASDLAEIQAKVRLMVTDPNRIKKNDPGNPEACVVHTYHQIYNPTEVEDIGETCKKGSIGCVACKKILAEKLANYLSPIMERRNYYSERPELLDEILEEGSKKAQVLTEKTLEEVRDVMGV